MYFKNDDNVDINYYEDQKKTKKKKINIKEWLPFIVFGVIILFSIILYIIASINDNNYSPPISNNTNLNYYIKLSGDEEITLYQGEKYVEPGYRGHDSKGTDLTSSVIVNNNIDYNKIGSYTITYSLNDITVTRKVNIITKPIGATYIHLYGESVMYINAGDKYVEPGYEVIDSIDGSALKKYVKIKNNINNNKAGVYQVVYSVINTSGITTTKVRNIIVMDSEISITTDTDEYTNQKVNINIYVNDIYFNYIILPDGNKVNQNKYTYSVTKNGTYKFIVYNKKGGKKEKSITISSINITKPSGSCSGYYQNGKSQITIQASDDVGIQKYVIDNNTYTTNTITVNKELTTANITIYDKAGNTNNITCKLEDKNIKYKQQKTLLSYSHPKGYTFNYWLSIPKNAKDNMPLIVFLHGDGYENKPNDLGKFFIVDKGQSYNNGDAGFFLIAPNTKEKGWTNGSIPSSLKGLIDKVVSDYKIDTSRIYIMGYSRGAIGTWYMVNSYPNLFAAAVPISCSPIGVNASNFKHTKIKAISGNSGGDEANYNSQMTSFVNSINSAGGHAEKVTYSGYTHFTIFKAFNIDDVFAWLLKQ